MQKDAYPIKYCVLQITKMFSLHARSPHLLLFELLVGMKYGCDR